MHEQEQLEIQLQNTNEALEKTKQTLEEKTELFNESTKSNTQSILTQLQRKQQELNEFYQEAINKAIFNSNESKFPEFKFPDVDSNLENILEWFESLLNFYKLLKGILEVKHT